MIPHPDMTCLLRLSQEMTDHLIFGQVKIEVCFHAPVMCMRGHRIPYAPWFQLSHSHLELARLHNAVDNKLINGSVICSLHGTRI